MDSQRPGFFARLGSLLSGLGFGWVVWHSYQHGMYGAIPFQMLFFVGFTYVAFLSLFQGKLTTR